jgi:hyaluronan synthase
MTAGWLLLAGNLVALVWRVVLVHRYRPVGAYPDGRLPTCTVVVPAYNEGRQVYRTLRSIVASDYPEGKLQVIAVDDGSRDDTWDWILRAAASTRGRILPLRLLENRGKRQALDAGFRRARGDIVVTIDSDAEAESGTLRCLLSPFVREPRLGAVAGNVRVLNRNQGLIPRMLDVAFGYAFDFIRASQSMVDTVMCTPGALAAYRRDLLMKVRPEWLTQRFCGREANIGEDRALTNLILREGRGVHFQRTAVVRTNVPVRYRGLCRMFLRWARSNIRETLVLSGFAFGRFRESPAWGARVNLLLHWLSMTVGQAMKTVGLGCLVWMPGAFGPHLLLGAVIAACVPAGFYAIRHRSTNAVWMYAYALFWLVGLSWIGLYAWLTPHRTGWLTRGIAGRAGMPGAGPVAAGPSGAAAPPCVHLPCLGVALSQGPVAAALGHALAEYTSGASGADALRAPADAWGAEGDPLADELTCGVAYDVRLPAAACPGGASLRGRGNQAVNVPLAALLVAVADEMLGTFGGAAPASGLPAA